jgi:hypothetical protein
MDRDITAIDCWIRHCHWFQNESNVHTGPARDEVRVEHMLGTHTTRELASEIGRRVRELGSDPYTRFTQEQVEDRNSIIRILVATLD